MCALGEGKSWEGLSLGVTEAEYGQLQHVLNRQPVLNPWFTAENVRQSLRALGGELKDDKLEEWLAPYAFAPQPKRIAIIMAGNIPLVGFHDFLCVLLSGNRAVCKMSSEDHTLLPALAEVLVKFCPQLSDRMVFSKGPLGEVDAVVATGSSNSMQHFERYFGKYPHIFRKNRTSVAVLDGTETKEDLKNLGHDVFDYFGLGCRNVSHLIVPENYDFATFFEAVFPFGNVINHFKYGNNYDYNKTVYMMNLHPLLDNNFLLLYESEELFSPLAMLYYHHYTTSEEIQKYLNGYKEDVQAVIGKGYIPFGKAQAPALDDYADGVDTMLWLSELNQ